MCIICFKFYYIFSNIFPTEKHNITYKIGYTSSKKIFYIQKYFLFSIIIFEKILFKTYNLG